MIEKRPWLFALAGIGFFIAVGILFLPYTGAQYDEVLFSSALYGPMTVEHVVKTPWGPIPTMLMTYLGALKAWLWYPILHLVGPGYAALRIPSLLLAALAAWIFFLALRRLAGGWAAIAGIALLVTDVNYLLSSLYDWGPVALQHVFWTTILYGGVRYSQERQTRWLALAAACVGLALWDKAICLWLILGFGAALLLFYGKPLWSALRQPRTLGLAVLAFVLGALPFLYYNEQHELRTFTASSGWTTDEYKGKIWLLDKILAGNGLFGYMVRWEQAPVTGLKPWESASVAISRWTREPRDSFQQVLVALVLLAMPVLAFGPYGRILLFFATGGLLSLLLMFSTPNAGGSVHHVILLWPLPQLLVALAVASVPRRAARFAAVSVLAGVLGNAAVMNQFLAQFVTCGSTVTWTDAIRPLVDKVGKYPGRVIFASEWGILEQFRYFGAGAIGTMPASDGVVRTLNEVESQQFIRRALNLPDTLYVGHTQEAQLFEGTRDKLDAFAQQEGFQKRLLATVQDRHGRSIFEVFEYVK
jgi:hypothetical protein